MDHKRIDLIRSAFVDLYGIEPEIWAQAPGRADLLGSHTDYNLGFVLTQAIDRNTVIAARPRTDKSVRISSINLEGQGDFHLDNIRYEQDHGWSNYVRGVANELKNEDFPLAGFDGLIHSTIPFGSGLSSSAALEVAVLELFTHIGNFQIQPLEKALICQRAENEFVGMNCGIMDQYSSVMGQQGCALLIDCRSLTSEIKTISPEIRVMICDTRAIRELTGSEYSSRRAQCEEGVRVLARYDPQIQSLRDVSRELLQKYENILDPVVYKRCHFVIEENLRVQKISCALEQGDRKMIGQVTEESFLGTKDLYQIVTEEMADMYTSIMNAPGTFGARAAGAGFGGCLVSFVDNNLTEVFSEHVFESYLNATGIEPEIFTVSAANGSGIADISNGN